MSAGADANFFRCATVQYRIEELSAGQHGPPATGTRRNTVEIPPVEVYFSAEGDLLPGRSCHRCPGCLRPPLSQLELVFVILSQTGRESIPGADHVRSSTSIRRSLIKIKVTSNARATPGRGVARKYGPFNPEQRRGRDLSWYDFDSLSSSIRSWPFYRISRDFRPSRTSLGQARTLLIFNDPISWPLSRRHSSHVRWTRNKRLK